MSLLVVGLFAAALSPTEGSRALLRTHTALRGPEKSETTEARLPLLPYPAELKLAPEGSKSFSLQADTAITLGEGVEKDDPAAASLRDVLKEFGGKDKSAGAITLSLKGKAEEGSAAEQGYSLRITDKGVEVEAPSSQGLFYAVQTLRQLVPREKGATAGLRALNISDAPRFTWRGLHLDVSRHFFTAKEVKRLLDAMGLFKLNRFHWHITDDQGWRLPVEGYPKLTEVGGEGKAYTKEEIQDVVAHAQARHIDVIPEIDVPGHVQAALAAYPELGNSDVKGWVKPTEPMRSWGISQYTLAPNNKTWSFLTKVFDTVAELFPGKIVHMGGDEVMTSEWSQSKAAKAAAASMPQSTAALVEVDAEGGEESAQDVAMLFNSKMIGMLKGKGRRVGAWDEAQHTGNFPSDGIVFAWNSASEATAAVTEGRQAVVCDISVLYFDHAQSTGAEPSNQGGCSSWKSVYQYEIMPEGLKEDQQKLILGAQGQLWSEYMPNWTHVEYMAHPRSMALAEKTWSPQASLGNEEEFEVRLRERLGDLDKLGVSHRGLDGGC